MSNTLIVSENDTWNNMNEFSSTPVHQLFPYSYLLPTLFQFHKQYIYADYPLIINCFIFSIYAIRHDNWFVQ